MNEYYKMYDNIFQESAKFSKSNNYEKMSINIQYLRIFGFKHSHLSLLPFLSNLIYGNKLRGINIVLEFNKYLKNYNKNISLLDINILSNNMIRINFNKTNMIISYNNNKKIDLITNYEIGLLNYFPLNEIIIDYSKIFLNNKKCNIAEIVIGDGSKENIINIIDNNYIEDISLIKSLTDLKKKNGIINYINDSYDKYYINKKDLKKYKFINWYDTILNYNINRYFKNNFKIPITTKKYDIIYSFIEWTYNTYIHEKNGKKNKTNWLIREYQIIPLLIYNILFAINNIKENGIFLIYTYEFYTTISQDIILLLTKIFKKVDFYNPKVEDYKRNRRFIYCYKYKENKNIIKLLKNIYNQFLENYNNNKKKFNIKEENRESYLFKKYLPDYNDKIHDDFMIYELFDQNKLNKKEKDFKEKINNFEKKMIKNHLSASFKWNINLKYKNKVDLTNDSDLKKYIKSQLKKNLTYCLKYCKEYDIKINNSYLNNNNNKLLNVLGCFPNIKGVDLTKIQFIDQSINYITEYHDAVFVNKIIENIFINKNIFNKKNDINVLDGTSHIGGNTIAFALNGFNTTGIEIDKDVYNLLNYNINLYKLKVKTICTDFVKFIPKINQDVVFLDPPWGGVNYKKIDKLELYLSKINLIDIVNKLKNKTKCIILKVPFNYNTQNFIKKNTFSRILQLIKLEKYYLIVLISEDLNLINLTK